MLWLYPDGTVTFSCWTIFSIFLSNVYKGECQHSALINDSLILDQCQVHVCIVSYNIKRTRNSVMVMAALYWYNTYSRGRRGRDRMVVGSTYAISAYHHKSCEFESCWWRGVLDTTLWDKVCQWLATCRWFSPNTPVFSTNATDRHDITEILLKAVLNTINLFIVTIISSYFLMRNNRYHFYSL